MIRRARLLQAIAAVTLYLVVGCAGAPGRVAGPAVGSSSDTTSDSSAAGPANAPAPATASGIAAPEVVVDTALVRAVALVGIIDGAAGGRLENEHVRLDIPAGAFTGTATITVTFPDPTRFLVDLDIQPATLNHFTTPVELRLKCSGKQLSVAPPAAWWWNPGDSLWYGLTASSYDGGGGDVRVQLKHFSRYGAGGKAGW
ncbi:MAG: hypothetical protein ABL977_16120 [Candidatus Eisenbacteria bacterium]